MDMMDSTPFFSTKPLGGSIDFRFMRKPWAKIDTLDLDPLVVRTPDSMGTGCWLHVSMADGSTKEEYQQELKRWHAVFSQTYIVNPANERTRHYHNAGTGRSAEIIDVHRDRIYSDGGDEEYNNMEPFAEAALRNPEKPPVGAMGSQDASEYSVDEAWGPYLDNMWAGANGLPLWVTREPDEPGIKFSDFTSLNQYPWTGIPHPDKNSNTKLTHCTGQDNFVTWFWLYRKPTGQTDGAKKPDVPNYDAPCVVLVGSVKWRVTHDYTFTWNGPNHTLNRGNTGTVFINPADPNTPNWQYLTLIPSPQPIYQFPSKAQFHHHHDANFSFPDLRVNSAINKYTYYVLKTKSANGPWATIGYFSKEGRIKEAEVQTKEPDHDDNILNPGWYPGKPKGED